MCSDHEASSDDDNSDDETAVRRNGFIVLQPPLERPDAVIDEDSNYEDTGDADRLPRRILNAAAEFSNLNRSGKTPTYPLRKFSKSPTRTAKNPLKLSLLILR